MMLLRLLSWPYLRRHVLRWALTIVGIALGVGAFVAIHTANGSTFHAFDHTIDEIAGAAQLQLTSGEFGFEESILERVQSVPQVSVAVPVIESTLEMPSGGEGTILLLGVDMTGDQRMRKYDLGGTDEDVDDPLVFLAQPDSLLVTSEFARRNQIAVNSRIPLMTTQGKKDFVIRGVMEAGGLAQAFGGNLAVMDIYAAQRVLGRGRRFDRIDIRVKDGVPVAECQAAIQRSLGPGFQVETPSVRGRHLEALLHGYSAGLAISSVFAVIVGMFLIYNSFAIALFERRAEIGILRALGATRGQIQKLFLVESLLAGAIGSGAGVALGLTTALAVARYLSTLLKQGFGVAQRVTEVQIDPEVIYGGVLIGVLTSMVAAWIPASNAARIDPIQALQKGKYQILFAGENQRRRRLAAVFAVGAIACLLLPAWNMIFYGGYILMIIAVLLLTPALSLYLSKAARPVLKRILPVEGVLAADSLIQAPRRTSATVSALMLSLAMVVAFAGYSRSFYAAVGDWLDHILDADFFVSPTTNLTEHTFTFPGSLGPYLETIEGVDQVQLVRNARVLFRQTPVLAVFIESMKEAGTTRPPVVAGSLEKMYELTEKGKGLIASENFSLIHKVKLGDIVDLPAPVGLLSLPVVGIVRSYSDLQGSVFVDRSLYLKWWKEDSANLARIYVKKGAKPQEVRRRILKALAGRQRLLVLTNREVRAWILRVLDQWFALTYNQVALAILVAILGIVNTLTVSITDRRREIGVVRAVGGLRTQVRRTVWMEAISIGAIGLVLGIVLGSINLYYTLQMVERSDFGGIDVNYSFPVAATLLMIPTILAAAFVAALGPGESAMRGSLVQALEYE
jgi:putative ABC transport system permease protein